MPRTLTAGMATAVAAQTGVMGYFIKVSASGGDIYLTTAPTDVSWDSQTWEGVGGALVFGAVQETSDASGQGVELTLSGVDQSIIALILTNNFRGREIRIWLAFFSDGAVVADPLEIFRGLQLSDYQVSEVVNNDDGTGTCDVTTSVQSRLAALRTPMPVRTNPVSHNDMLARAGLTTGDTFFQNTASIAGREIGWGTVDTKRWFETLKRKQIW